MRNVQNVDHRQGRLYQKWIAGWGINERDGPVTNIEDFKFCDTTKKEGVMYTSPGALELLAQEIRREAERREAILRRLSA